MAVTTTVVTVGTTETTLADGGSRHYANPLGGEVENLGSVSVYIGGTGVTTSGAGRGQILAAGAKRTFTLGPGDKLKGIVATGTCDVHVIAVGA